MFDLNKLPELIEDHETWVQEVTWDIKTELEDNALLLSRLVVSLRKEVQKLEDEIQLCPAEKYHST